MRARIACLVLAAALPLLVAAHWQSLHEGYPRGDAGDYFRVTQRNYIVGRALPFPRGIVENYLYRGKPILHPFLGYFALEATGGRVRPAVLLMQLAAFATLLAYLFLLASSLFGDRNAIAATAFLGTIPWVLNCTHGFNAELYFLAAACAALFHLYRSRDFTHGGHTAAFGFWLAAAFCSRPMEGALSFVAPVLIASGLAVRRRTLRGRDIAVAGALTAAALGLIILKMRLGQDLPPRWGWTLVAALPALAWIARRRLGLSRIYLIGFSVFLSLSLLWWVHAPNRLYEWSTMYIFPPEHDQNHGQGPWFIVRALASLGNTQLLLLALSGLVAALAVRRRDRAALKRLRNPFIGFLIPTVLFPICVATFSSNPATRYYYFSGLCFFLIALWILLGPEGLFGRWRAFLIAPALALNIAYAWGITHDSFNPPYLLARYSGDGRPDEAPTPHDPSLEIYGKIAPRIAEPEFFYIYVISLRARSRETGIATDPWALTEIAREDGKGWRFEWADQVLHDFDRPRQLFDQTSYLLVGPTDGGANLPLNPVAKLGMDILVAWKQHRLSQLGLEQLSEVPYVPGDGAPTSYLLLKVAGSRPRPGAEHGEFF